MSTTSMSLQETANVFADPVTYLAGLGLTAELISDPVPLAA
jgi:hypothetical protein